ncbi:hypothetical protein [Actinosynnema sp. NPDC023587]|uniref:hypothetical protein n=1 Tax=Actinosynnema sp. NPDC023587 TaxID=3154695 RepID=UPI0033F42542
MSAHYDDPDRTPPRGIPAAGTGGGRYRAAPAGPATGSPDAWAAAEAQHRARRHAPPEERRVRPAAPRPDDGAVAHQPFGAPLDQAHGSPVAEDGTAYGGRFAPPSVDPDGWSVAPAVIGGDLPEAVPASAPPPPPPAAPPEPEAAPAKRSFLGKLFRRND